MTLTVDAFAQLFDGVQVHVGPVIPGIHDFGHYHAWSSVGTEGFCRILMRISFAKCWKLVDASFDSASADLFSFRLISRILNEANLDVSCRACSR
ncbi:hypothetical protein Hanom_Chr03g00253141 [Helianthus anomalus]